MRFGFLRGAVALWLVPLLVISGMVAANPVKRTVTLTYHDASKNWAHRQTLYEGTAGMHYLPPFVVLYAPFEWLPLRSSEVAWRWLGTAMIAGGLWKISRRSTATAEQAEKVFFIATLIALPLSLPAIRNGQANATLAGLFLLATASALSGQRWCAVVFLALAIAVKPLGVAALGLAVAVYPALLVPSLVATAAVFLLPFATAPSSYVLGQYRSAWDNLRECAVISENRFADLNGILRAFGTELNGPVGLAVRAFAGLTMFGLCAIVVRRLAPPDRALAWYGFSALYLMLFNPMTEANSYVILAPVMGLVGALAWNRLEPKWTWIWGGAALSMGLLPNLVRHWFGNGFALVWHPIMAFLFMGWLVAWILQSRTATSKSSLSHAAGST